MGYMERNRMVGESIIYRARRHWIIFKWPIIWVMIVAVITGFCIWGECLSDAKYFILVPLSIGILAAIGPFINYTTSEFGVTNKRVIVKFGFVRRYSLEMLLNKIEGIEVKQNIFGRILGYGSITVSGTGGSRDPFPYISAPLHFRRKVQEQIEVSPA